MFPPRLAPSLLLCAIGALTIAAWALARPPAAEESHEPPLEITLTLDGRKHELKSGREFEITVKGEKLSGRIEIAPTRTLRLAELEFCYPQYYSFEFEKLNPGAQWTLDGHNHVLILTRIPDATLADVLRDTLAELPAEWRQAADDSVPCSRKLGGREWTGRCFEVQIAGIAQHQELLLLQVDKSVLLFWSQDTLDQPGKPTAEAEATRKLIEKTMRLR
jgi:hypothetical protein